MSMKMAEWPGGTPAATPPVSLMQQAPFVPAARAPETARAGQPPVAAVFPPAVEPAAGAVAPTLVPTAETITSPLVKTRLVDIDAMAPDFEADAYHKGERKHVRLSDYRGRWVVLLFYSSDFTFV